jgi:hypothetical protein
MKKLTKKQQEIYDRDMEYVNYYLRDSYPDFRYMPKQAKERYRSIKEFYRDMAIIKASNGPINLGKYYD